ncbi:MAG: helix-turn-helix transcriptional regulator [bacterium]
MTRDREPASQALPTMPRSLVEGQALRMLRQHRELTQGQLAQVAGVSRAAISDFERGHRAPAPEALERLLRALKLPERAWHDTVRHIEWIEWLRARRDHCGAPGVAGLVGADASDRDRIIQRVAESLCRDLERHVVDILNLVVLP